jgi:hypothetical protein
MRAASRTWQVGSPSPRPCCSAPSPSHTPAALVAYAHSRGISLGWYMNCCGCPAEHALSEPHYVQDAQVGGGEIFWDTKVWNWRILYWVCWSEELGHPSPRSFSPFFAAHQQQAAAALGFDGIKVLLELLHVVTPRTGASDTRPPVYALFACRSTAAATNPISRPGLPP